MSPAKKAADVGGGSPKLLSGGNPQIPKGDGDEPVQAWIGQASRLPSWTGF